MSVWKGGTKGICLYLFHKNNKMFALMGDWVSFTQKESVSFQDNYEIYIIIATLLLLTTRLFISIVKAMCCVYFLTGRVYLLYILTGKSLIYL